MPSQSPITLLTDKSEILDLSKYVVLFFLKSGSNITNLTLQKIMYYIQAWRLVYFDGNPLFMEQPQAWINGPAYPSIYRKFKSFGSDNIEFREIGFSKFEIESEKIKDEIQLNNNDVDLIRSVILAYGKMSPFELVYLTHSEKPWLEAREGLSPVESSTKLISWDSMKEYYGAKLKKTKQKIDSKR